VVYTFAKDTGPLLKAIVTDEVKNTLSASTLFRSNNVASKMLSLYAMEVGKECILITTV
jgi:hypothetical protein